MSWSRLYFYIPVQNVEYWKIVVSRPPEQTRIKLIFFFAAKNLLQILVNSNDVARSKLNIETFLITFIDNDDIWYVKDRGIFLFWPGYTSSSLTLAQKVYRHS